MTFDVSTDKAGWLNKSDKGQSINLRLRRNLRFSGSKRQQQKRSVSVSIAAQRNVKLFRKQLLHCTPTPFGFVFFKVETFNHCNQLLHPNSTRSGTSITKPVVTRHGNHGDQTVCAKCPPSAANAPPPSPPNLNVKKMGLHHPNSISSRIMAFTRKTVEAQQLQGQLKLMCYLTMAEGRVNRCIEAALLLRRAENRGQRLTLLDVQLLSNETKKCIYITKVRPYEWLGTQNENDTEID